ncbi:hypothetical protein [Streptomyces sp. NPDC003395]
MPTDPTWQNTLTYDGAELRRADMMMVMGDGTALGGRSGLRPGDPGLAVTLAGSTINVSAGVSALYRSGQGLYRAFLPSSVSPGTVAAANATFSRIDLVYLRVWDTDVDSTGLRKADAVYLQGTASATPAQPTPGVNEIYIPLAKITVPQSGGGSPSLVDLRPVTVAPGGILPGANNSPPNPYTGQYWDDGTNLRRWNGSLFETYGPLPTWQSYTPTWTGLTNQGSGAQSLGRWLRFGNTVTVKAALIAGTSPSLGTNQIQVSMPIAASMSAPVGMDWLGRGKHNPANGSAWTPLVASLVRGSSTAIVYGQRQSDLGYIDPGDAGYVFVAGSSMHIEITYEV